MEKQSSVDRVAGQLTDEQRRLLLFKKKIDFENQESRLPFENVIEKSEDDLRMISEINTAINGLRKKFGLDEFIVPEKNVHFFVDKNREKSGNRVGGGYYQELQSAFVPWYSEMTVKGKNCFHELVHFLSYGAMQKRTDTGDIAPYRTGLSMDARSKEKAKTATGLIGGVETEIELPFGDELNEAVTEELAKRYILSQRDNPLYAKDFKQTEDFKSYMKERGRSDYDDNDIFAIHIDSDAQSAQRISFGYKDNRTALEGIIDGIFKSEKNAGKFKDRDQVFDVFVRAMFTGHLMELAHVIDGTFGKGTLRKIMEP